MFDEALNALLNAIISNLIKKIGAEAILKNRQFYSVKYRSIKDTITM